MYRKVKKVMLSQANDVVPDRWDNIRAAAVQALPQKTPIVCKSRRKTYRFAALAASLCIVIAATVIMGPELMNDNNFGIGNVDTSGGTTTPTPSVTDKILWNNAYSAERIAGTFEKVSEKEWLEKYSLTLPKSLQFEYSFVYSIPKDGETNTGLMCGHLANKISETQWISAYVSTGDSVPSAFTDPKFDKSIIGGVEVVIGKYEDTSWGYFKAQSYLVRFEAHNFDEVAIIDFIKGFN